jgi:hypothetical protein
MSEKQSRGVSSVRREIAIVAGPRDWCDTRESWLARVPRKVQTVTFRTVKALWYGEITDPEHWAARDIRRAAELIEAKQEAASLASQFQTIAGGMRATDQDFYSTEIDRLERLARIIGGLDRA